MSATNEIKQAVGGRNDEPQAASAIDTAAAAGDTLNSQVAASTARPPIACGEGGVVGWEGPQLGRSLAGAGRGWGPKRRRCDARVRKRQGAARAPQPRPAAGAPAKPTGAPRPPLCTHLHTLTSLEPPAPRLRARAPRTAARHPPSLSPPGTRSLHPRSRESTSAPSRNAPPPAFHAGRRPGRGRRRRGARLPAAGRGQQAGRERHLHARRRRRHGHRRRQAPGESHACTICYTRQQAGSRLLACLVASRVGDLLEPGSRKAPAKRDSPPAPRTPRPRPRLPPAGPGLCGGRRRRGRRRGRGRPAAADDQQARGAARGCLARAARPQGRVAAAGSVPCH